MSNILERHLEQNIEPNVSRESYIDQAIQIFQDMKEEDITDQCTYKEGNRYCLNGLFCRMTGFIGNAGFYFDSAHKLGDDRRERLSTIHFQYIHRHRDFEKMRQ